MQTYAAISTCRREFLLRYFDDKWGACVNCDNCAATAGEYLPPELSGGDAARSGVILGSAPGNGTATTCQLGSKARRVTVVYIHDGAIQSDGIGESQEDSRTPKDHSCSLRLFVSKGHHGIDTGRAVRGNETGQGCHRDENERYQDRCRDILGVEAVKQSRQQVRRSGCQDQAYG